MSKVICTDVKTKRENFHKFIKHIENQFEHGGDKYALPGQQNKEFTDLVCEAAPGKTGYDWILQTIIKYCGRILAFNRERDYFKIATYAYIAWLKGGFHLQQEHDEDIGKVKLDVEEGSFCSCSK